MRKRLCLLLAALLALCLCSSAFAERFEGPEGWRVILRADETLESNLSDLHGDVTLEPGDEAAFTVALENRSAVTADWYLANEILRSLEDGSSVAAGGAYAYELRWQDPDGSERVLFSGEVVGGEIAAPSGEQGLHEIEPLLKDYVFLVTLAPGQSGVVKLRLSLEGESLGDDYQLTHAELRLRIAAALHSGDGVDIVVTGDETPEVFPYYIIMLASGFALLVLLTVLLLRRRKEGRSKE